MSKAWLGRVRAGVRDAVDRCGLLHAYRRAASLGKAAKFDRAFTALRREIDGLEETGERRALLVTGLLTVPAKPTLYPFFTRLTEAAPDLRIVLLDESRREAPADAPVERLVLPRALDFGMWDANSFMKPTQRDDELARRYDLIEPTVDRMLDRQMDVGRSGMRRLVCAYADAYERLIRRIQPRAVLIWCQFTKLHPLCAQIARAHGVKVLYMEFGSIPGTFAMEDQGQMGESRIATEWESFLSNSVTAEEIDRAGQVLDFLRESGLNRNKQTDLPALGELQDAIDADRPLIVFAGQNDFDSGLIPWDDHARTHHSPAYRNSLEAAEAVARIAREEGWQFAYKPHPFMDARGEKIDLPVIHKCNFNAMMDRADVVVSGVSQSGYVACIRRRPCVTVGYNQLRGKGCTYEAVDGDALRETLRTALKEGCTDRQQKMFRMHTAQLLKYALYDDLGERSLRYGRSPEEAAAWLSREMGV